MANQISPCHERERSMSETRRRVEEQYIKACQKEEEA